MAVVYGEKKVTLSRVYPFGQKVEVAGKEVTEVTLKELNGHDAVAISREMKSDKLAGYLQISASMGVTYDDALLLADKDANKLTEELSGF